MANELGQMLRAAREALSAQEGRKVSRERVGKAVGVSHVAVGQWEKGETVPTIENLKLAAKFLRLDEKTVLDVWLGLEQGTHSPPPSKPADPPPSVVEVPDAPSFKSRAGRLRNVEILGGAVGGFGGDFRLNGKTIGYAPRPAPLEGRDIFAVRVTNESMWPRFKDGELIYVERHREPAIGDDAIVELLPDEPDEPGPAYVKQMVRKSASEVVVLQHNPREEITYPRARVKRLYRVVPWNEVLGV